MYRYSVALADLLSPLRWERHALADAIRVPLLIAHFATDCAWWGCTR